MATNFLKIRNGLSLGSLSSAPSPASSGDIYYDTTLNQFQFYQNGTWQALGSGGGSSDAVNVIVTTGGTTTLAANTTADPNLGKDIQVFTGTNSQIVKLPVATAMTVAQKIELYNESTQAITIQFEDGTAFTDAAGISKTTIPPNQFLVVKVQTNATANGTWVTQNASGGAYTQNLPTIQKFLSGSGTYTTPAGVAYIEVEMVGGGGGGQGSDGGAAAGNGGTTTFGTSLLTANGGQGGQTAGSQGGTGGTATISLPAIGVAFSGGSGTGIINQTSATIGSPGGPGGTNPLGGNGGGGSINNNPGQAGAANTGAGGGGAAGPYSSSGSGGTGGGAGGYVKAIINSPSASYTYSVGASGTAGAAGSGGAVGGAGGSGVIIVREYYGVNIPQGATVTGNYGPALSTAGQTVINLPFSVTVANFVNLTVLVDGKHLAYGSSYDYTFSSVVGGVSSTILLNEPIPTAGLNIQVIYLGTALPGSVVNTANSGLVKNYFATFGNLETGSASGFSLFNTTLSSFIPTTAPASGASSITTFTATSTSPLSGTYSLSVGASTALTAGQGFITQAVTIDQSDQAKMLAFRFTYKVNSGTFNLSGSSANTWAVYFYDTANAAWVQPAGVYSLVQSSGVGIASGTFQTASNATSYQMALVCINSTSGAVSMEFDDFQLTQQTNPMGPAMTDWTPYSVTIGSIGGTAPTKGTIVVDQGHWRRVGDSIEINYDYQQSSAGSTGSSIYTFSLPAGITVDSTKINTSGANALGACGSWSAFDGSLLYVGTVSAYVNTIFLTRDDEAIGAANVGASCTPLGGTVARYSIQAKLPVVGWSSNTSQSSDTDTRVCAFRNHAAGSNYNYTVGTLINFNSTADFDTHGAYNAGTYTVPVSGYYNVAITDLYSTSANTNFKLYKNGVEDVGLCQVSSSVGVGGSALVKTNAGDTITIVPDNTGTLLVTTSILPAVSIYRISGPAVISATESVNMAYGLTTSVVTSANSPIKYDTKLKDSHNAYSTSTGLYTVPVSGMYQISVVAAISSGSTNILLSVNGVLKIYIAEPAPNASQGSVSYPFNAGDTIGIVSPSAVTSVGISSGTIYQNYVSIQRVGN